MPTKNVLVGNNTWSILFFFSLNILKILRLFMLKKLLRTVFQTHKWCYLSSKRLQKNLFNTLELIDNDKKTSTFPKNRFEKLLMVLTAQPESCSHKGNRTAFIGKKAKFSVKLPIRPYFFSKLCLLEHDSVILNQTKKVRLWWLMVRKKLRAQFVSNR